MATSISPKDLCGYVWINSQRESLEKNIYIMILNLNQSLCKLTLQTEGELRLHHCSSMQIPSLVVPTKSTRNKI